MQITPDPITVCDLTHLPGGGNQPPAVKTHTFWHDGKLYEVDTCEEHDARISTLLDDVRTAAKAGRVVDPKAKRKRSAGAGPSSSGRSSAATRRHSADVREWAEANGYELPGRGRIPEAVKKAYAAAHPT